MKIPLSLSLLSILSRCLVTATTTTTATAASNVENYLKFIQKPHHEKIAEETIRDQVKSRGKRSRGKAKFASRRWRLIKFSEKKCDAKEYLSNLHFSFCRISPSTLLVFLLSASLNHCCINKKVLNMQTSERARELSC